MQLNNYLFFDGRCEEAFARYLEVLGGTMLAMIRHTGTPAEEHVPPEWRDKIMHACLEIDGRRLMGSDAPPGRGSPLGGFSIQIATDSVEEAERVFAALGQGGTITMPIAQTFWAERFGMLKDEFGVPWMVNFEGAVKFEHGGAA
jgi:PhnB protein